MNPLSIKTFVCAPTPFDFDMRPSLRDRTHDRVRAYDLQPRGVLREEIRKISLLGRLSAYIIRLKSGEKVSHFFIFFYCRIAQDTLQHLSLLPNKYSTF